MSMPHDDSEAPRELLVSKVIHVKSGRVTGRAL